MKKTKLTIDLGNLDLTDKQKSQLLNAVHKTVSTKLQSQTAASTTAGGATTTTTRGIGLTATPPPPAATQTKTVTVSVTFKTVDAGLSELEATIGNQQQTIDQSGDLVFKNVKTPAALLVKGKSLGTTTVDIDTPADPQTKSFVPGTFFFLFKLS